MSRSKDTSARWWHFPFAFLMLAMIWALHAYTSNWTWKWDDVLLGFITGGILTSWAVEFTGNKTAHTILKEWREELSRRPGDKP